MANRPTATDVSTLPPRAAVALLALQLRTAEREAGEAEERERGWDLDTALEQLRARMTALITARGAALDAAFADERTAADEAIAAARARRALRALPAPSPFPAPTVDAAGHDSSVDDVLDVDIDVLDDTGISDAVIEAATIGGATIEAPARFDANVADVAPAAIPINASPETASRAVWGPPTTEPVAPLTADEVRSIVAGAIERLGGTGSNGMPINATIEPEAFARAFATAFGAAFGAMLDERLVAYQAVTPVAQWPRFAPTPGPAKRSFWNNIWHADVMISMLAAAIVLVVLIAWST